MATKPELRRAVANSYIKASDYNYNFEQLNNYIENGVADNAINNYEADREYSKGQWVLANTSEGKGLYESQVDGNKGNSLLDTTYWKKVGSEIFDILDQFVAKDSLQEVQVVVETYVNGTSWYRVWSDGWCEQGGIAYVSNQTTTVTFLKPFIDLTYYSNCSSISDSTYSAIASTESRTTTSMGIRSLNTSNWAWIACGYIA